MAMEWIDGWMNGAVASSGLYTNVTSTAPVM